MAHWLVIQIIEITFFSGNMMEVISLFLTIRKFRFSIEGELFMPREI